jgi:glycosyltransferase involved in cell wall biosynthesis
MKLLTISNCPLLEYQGSGYIIVNFYRELERLGHEIDVFGPDDYEILPALRPRGNYYRKVAGMAALAVQKIQQHRYDIIEFYGAESWFAVSVIRALDQSRTLQDKRPLLISHSNGIETHMTEVMAHYKDLLEKDPWDQPRPYQFLKGIMNRINRREWAFSRVDALVVNSAYDLEFVKQQSYVDPDHVYLVENPLPDFYLGQEGVEFSRPPVIGYCGSWIGRKGIHILKSDIPQILQEFPQARFALIGVGSDFVVTEHFPAPVIAQIEVIPYLEDKEDLKKMYHRLSILVTPSIYESFGLVIAEAMSCGCAVIASATGFAWGLKDQEEIFLLPTPTSPHLYTALKALLTQEELRVKLAQKGYQRVQSLQWASSAQALSQVYAQWVKDYQNPHNSHKVK